MLFCFCCLVLFFMKYMGWDDLKEGDLVKFHKEFINFFEEYDDSLYKKYKNKIFSISYIEYFSDLLCIHLLDDEEYIIYENGNTYKCYDHEYVFFGQAFEIVELKEKLN